MLSFFQQILIFQNASIIRHKYVCMYVCIYMHAWMDVWMDGVANGDDGCIFLCWNIKEKDDHQYKNTFLDLKKFLASGHIMIESIHLFSYKAIC